MLPKPQLLIVGHGRIAETLAALGRLMNFAVIVDDPGGGQGAFPDADRVFTDDYDLSQPVIDGQTYIVIATQHKQDHRWLERALASPTPYIALIASRFRAGLVLDYLAESGVPREKLARVSAPAGLDIGAASPEEIASAEPAAASRDCWSRMRRILAFRFAAVLRVRRWIRRRPRYPVRHNHADRLDHTFSP